MVGKRERASGDNPSIIDQAKRLALIAICSDDRLLDTLVLKGGNALQLAYGLTARASIDLDFSMEGEFAPDSLEPTRTRIAHRLRQSFRSAGLDVFDIEFTERPPEVSEEFASFWGGYRVEFKVLPAARFRELAGDLSEARRQALPVGPRNRSRFRIDISKFERCVEKKRIEIDGYTVFVYTPAMIIAEKLRAICQQRPDYTTRLQKHRSERARDFFDIHETLQHCRAELDAPAYARLIREVFEAKRVPLRLLGEISQDRELHRTGWPAVVDTTEPTVNLRSFDFYFDFVLDMCKRLQPLWNEYPPA